MQAVKRLLYFLRIISKGNLYTFPHRKRKNKSTNEKHVVRGVFVCLTSNLMFSRTKMFFLILLKELKSI